jgi:hypothetical protein
VAVRQELYSPSNISLLAAGLEVASGVLHHRMLLAVAVAAVPVVIAPTLVALLLATT